jgi:SAM-dependent methyltransferase
MKLDHVKFLCDPKTGEDLNIITKEKKESLIISGDLISESNTYPIINGIPRFVNFDGYSKNFGWQWNKWSKVQFESENVNSSMEGYSEDMFFKITDFDKKSIKNKLILDIGCGSGRFLDIVNKYDGLAIGLDYTSAIDVAKSSINNENVLFIQADALNLPLKAEIVDYVYSIGVLHHTPDPKKGVEEVYKVLKKEGSFAISLYSAESLYTFISVKIWRKIFTALWPIFGPLPAFVYSQFFGRTTFYIAKLHIFLTYPIRLFFPTAVLPDVRWSVLDTFDKVTTSFQSGHTEKQVISWFESIAFRDITIGNWWPVNIIGKK